MNNNTSAPKIPLQHFFKNPEKTGFKISPNGAYISYLAPYENRLNIFVQKVGDDKAKCITRETDRSIAGYFWANDNCLLYAKDNKGDENFHLFSVDIEGKEVKDLTPFPDAKVMIVDELEDNETELLIQLNKRNPQIFDVYRLNIETGEMIMVAENPGNISAWHTDHEGKIRAATATDGVNASILYRENEGQPFKVICTTNFKESLSPIMFTFDNQYVYAVSNIGRDKSAIVIYDIVNNKEIKEVFSHPDVDVGGIIHSRKRKVLTGVHYTTHKIELSFFDEISQKRYERLVELLGKELEIFIASSNKNEDIFLVRTINDRSMGSYYLYDSKTDTLTKLTDVSPWLNQSELAEMKPITYEARDGLKIQGYLTLPKGVEAKNLPVVVNPHGGPWARDTWMFNPEVQFLANRGYAVLQMNFRGSTGYGRKFWECSFKQWGRAMQDDITDGVQWLIKQGIADPERIAIYGGSYGGYATLAGVTFTPDLYACAIDYVGVSNLFTFLDSIPPYWKPYIEMMYEMVGHPEKDKELLEASSPVFHVDQIKAPLFVAQGAMDPRVKKSESDQIVAALQKRDVAVQYLVKDNEGHGFHNQENKFEFYQAMEDFLDRHLQKQEKPMPVVG